MAKNSTPQHASLTPDKLRWHCDPARIPFETTAQVEPSSGDMGQERALRALRMGIELTASGYNLFVCGLSGTSRGGMIVRMIEDLHPQNEPAPDRCYVNNFKNTDRPRLLTLPRGLANAFKKEVESGVDFLRRRIPQVFEGEPFQRQKTRIVERFTVREKELMDDFTRRIAREQFALGRMQVGAVALPEIFPVLDGHHLPFENGENLRQRHRAHLHAAQRKLIAGDAAREIVHQFLFAEGKALDDARFLPLKGLAFEDLRYAPPEEVDSRFRFFLECIGLPARQGQQSWPVRIFKIVYIASIWRQFRAGTHFFDHPLDHSAAARASKAANE
ncbi:MAG TPA: Lon-like protease helical domain-containing protein [Candidatus Acidoferrales bacterium]|nr:Lon-like protease helical domain-containing protein [Candidatus Acidoferrales bacterium]